MSMTDDFDALLKEVYVPERVVDLTIKDHPFLAILSKNDKVATVGSSLVTAVVFGQTPGRSALFASAQANATTGAAALQFVQGTYDDYLVVQIPRKLFKGTNSLRALAEAKTIEFDNQLKHLGDSLSHALYRDGSGKIATVATLGSGTMTLSQAEDMRFLYRGQVLQASSGDGSSSGDTLRSGSITITGLTRSSKTVTFSGTITGLAVADSLFSNGDFRAKLPGLSGFMPITRSSGTSSFLGLDRQQDWDMLGGFLVGVQGLSEKEAIITTHTVLCQYSNGAKPTKYFCNPSRWKRLEVELGANVRYTTTEVKSGEYTFGVRGIALASSEGELDVIADPDCPVNDGFCVDPSSWELGSIGMVPEIHSDDGTLLRVYNADAIELRASYYATLRCFAPGYNARTSYTTAPNY